MEYVYIPYGPMFERGQCVSPAHLLKVPFGGKRPYGIIGELYANKQTSMIEVRMNERWVEIGTFDDNFVRETE